jgi:hypothetical protein
VPQFCDKALKKQILGDIWILGPHLGDKTLKKQILGPSVKKIKIWGFGLFPF